jgi:hypothetical protein
MVLLIKRPEGFWYYPGGLAKPSDGYLRHTASRHLKEKINIDLIKYFEDVHDSPDYLYESLMYKDEKPYRHNIMAMYFVTHRLPVLPEPTINDSSIKGCMWLSLPHFVAKAEATENTPDAITKPSAMLAVDHWIDQHKYDQDTWDFCFNCLDHIRGYASVRLRSVCLIWMISKARPGCDMTNIASDAASLVSIVLNEAQWK